MESQALTQQQYTILLARLNQQGPITNATYQKLSQPERWRIALYLKQNGYPVPEGLLDIAMRQMLTEEGYQAGYTNRAGTSAWAKGEGRGYFRIQESQTEGPVQTTSQAKNPATVTKGRINRRLQPSSELARHIGHLLAKTRKQKGLTQTDLTRLMGKGAQKDVSHFENGTDNSTLQTVEEMFASLGKKLVLKVENI